MTSFETWLDKYLNFERTPKKNIFWLDTMNYLCACFNHPEKEGINFHVAGSKGKGTISSMIASILEQSGRMTGLYTSPHILSFYERISTAKGLFPDDVYKAAEKKVIETVENIDEKNLPGERPLTWFELVTIFAMETFRVSGTKCNVYETGLGGRLDATNAIKSDVCCIGIIEKEHTEYLGDTLEKIAFEKAGIIKEGVPVIVGPQKDESVKNVFRKAAKEKNAPIIFADEAIKNYESKLSVCENNGKFHIKQKICLKSDLFARDLNFELSLLGEFQYVNAFIASCAVKAAFPEIDEKTIEEGFEKAFLPGRFEIISQKPLVVLDGAHTEKSIAFTMDSFNEINDAISSFDEFIENKEKILLFGCASDKNVEKMAEILCPFFSKIIITKPGNVKACDFERMKIAFESFKKCGEIDFMADYNEAIEKAFNCSKENNSPLLVTGSFYLVAEVKKILKNSAFCN